MRATSSRMCRGHLRAPLRAAKGQANLVPANMLSEPPLVGDLFHTASGTAFADIPINNHRETWPIRSKRFRGWLRQWHYEATGAAATAADIRSALDLLEARAQFDGPERAVHIRIARDAERLYLDLADEDWRVVEIGREGWRVITSPPVRFRRSAGIVPLPIPEQGGSIEALNSLSATGSASMMLSVAARRFAA